jgi:hypothetical protein
MSVAVGLAERILERPDELRCKFGSPGQDRILAGFLFQAWARRALNLAEETVFEELLIFDQQRFSLSAEESNSIKLNEICRSPFKVFCV